MNVIDLSPHAVWWLVGISVVVFLASPVIIGVLLVLMPADYFVRRRRRLPGDRWPVLRIVVRVAKNLLGIVLMLAGLVMLVTPGQGILALLAGLTLVDFPGKRKLERKIARNERVRRTVNRLRERFGRKPYDVPA